PVDTHHVGAGLAEQTKQLTGSHTEVDARDIALTELVEDPRAVRQHRGAVVLGAQDPGPGVEQLDRARTRIDLCTKEAERDGRQAAHQLVPQFGLAVQDRKSTRLNSSHVSISYAVFCLKKKISTKRL